METKTEKVAQARICQCDDKRVESLKASFDEALRVLSVVCKRYNVPDAEVNEISKTFEELRVLGEQVSEKYKQLGIFG